MKKCYFYTAIFVLSVLITMVSFGCSEKEISKEDQIETEMRALQKIVQRNQDYIEIQNLMSRRAFYHGATAQADELPLYADRPDISFGMNDGFRVGMKNIAAVYRERFNKVRAQEVERISKLFPEVKNDKSSMGVGMFQMHTLTTPIIEVAEDGQTAKGMWYTPGMVGGVDKDGKLQNEWLWEKYAVDFIKENGQWKFWHILVSTDFADPLGKDLNKEARKEAPQGAEGAQKTQTIPSIPKDIKKVAGKVYGPTRVPSLYPPMPVPYKTFSETFSYGPDIPPPPQNWTNGN